MSAFFMYAQHGVGHKCQPYQPLSSCLNGGMIIRPYDKCHILTLSRFKVAISIPNKINNLGIKNGKILKIVGAFYVTRQPCNVLW